MGILVSRASPVQRMPHGLWPVAAIAVIGFIACQYATTYVLASAVVIGWGVCRSRWTAYGLVITYSLFSCWVVVPAIIDYLQWHTAKALLFWAVSLSVTLLPWLLLHRSDTKYIEGRLAIILVISFAAPIGYIQFASPFVGTSLLLAGQGWISVIAGIVLCGAMIRASKAGKYELLLLLVAGIALSHHLSTDNPRDIEGWRAVDTAVKVGGFQHTIEGSMAALSAAKRVVKTETPEVVVLGESTGGYSVEGGEMVLGSALRHSVVVAGGRVDNKQSLFVWSKDGSENVYHQRLRPVLLEHMDGELNGNRTVEINGYKVAPLICYEGAVPYTIITALMAKPDVLLSIANFSFSRNDAYFERVLRAHIEAWGLVFDLPVIVAVNRRSIGNV